MLDNEPNATPRQDSDGKASNTPPASDAAATTDTSTKSPAGDKPARKRAASKRTAKKAAATTNSPDPAPTASDQPIPAGSDQPTAGSDQAAAAKKGNRRASKKTAAKKAAAPSDSAESLDHIGTSGSRSRKGSAPVTAEATAPADTGGAGEPDSGQAPAKKTSRKRISKKAAAAKKLAAVDPAAVDAAAAPVPQTATEAATEPRTRTRGRTRAARTETVPEVATETGSGTDTGTETAAERESARSRAAAAAAAAAVLFQPPVELAEPPRRRTRKKAGQSEPVAEQPADTVEDVEEPADTETDEHDAESGEGDGSRRRRRRRGGRRRRKSGEADGADADETDEEADAAPDAAADKTPDEAEAEAGDEDGDGSGTTRRRRRRRRRKGEDGATSPDDPDETVVRVREPRAKNKESEITAVEGSTRLEAKKQRRREGRAAGRRRAPIVSEAEFLARRESVERTMVIRTREDLTQIAVSEDNVLVEHYVAQAEQTSLIGNVYLGRVQNVLPSMEAAFIDIGKGRNAVLYAGEVDWATLGASNGQRKIESVLKSGQAVLVQVTKDPVGHKGARLTNQISLPGRYVVYVPRGGNGGISRKLPDTERNRLKGILKDIVPDEAGVIVRTAAEGASEEELTRDVSRLKSYWDDIEKKSGNGQAPQLLYGEPDLLIRVVRDLFTEDFTKLVISGDVAFDLVNEYVSYVAPHLAARVEKWTGDGDVFANFRIDEQIRKALDRKVWLPSGGSLIIDRTEAMTVVDVNTGKFTGSGGNLEETVTRNNLEAAEEIVRQLRLRDIGGIIVVDFIDMVLESNRDLVLRRLVECLGRDRTKHQVAEVTSLGLVQMTRKRIGTGLLEAFTETCDHCGGRGLLLHDEPREPKRKAQAEEQPKAKSSRGGGRGKGRKAKQETVEEQPNDAAQRLAEIAAATVAKDVADATEEPADERSDEQAEASELAVAPV